MSWGDGVAARRLEKVIYSQTAFSAGSNFFFTPRFCPTRVQQLHLSHSGDAPALMICQAPSTQPYRQITNQHSILLMLLMLILSLHKTE